MTKIGMDYLSPCLSDVAGQLYFISMYLISSLSLYFRFSSAHTPDESIVAGSGSSVDGHSGEVMACSL